MTLTLVTVLSFSVFASASDSAPVIVEGENYTIIKQDGLPIMTRDVTWIETTHYTGKSAYSTSITCAEGEGNALNVFIDNTNGNGTLNVIFTIDGQEIAEEDLPLLQLPKGKAQTYGKRCGFSKRYFLVLVACRHLTCTKTECRKMFLSLIAPLTTIRLNRGKRSNRLPYIFAQGQER